MTEPDPVERLPLTLPVFQVLLSLCESPMHGYAILSDIKSRTHTTVELGAGTLYAAIKRMAKAGMVEECDPPKGEDAPDGRRRYYKITEHGKALAAAEARRIQALAALASRRNLIPERVPAPAER